MRSALVLLIVLAPSLVARAERADVLVRGGDRDAVEEVVAAMRSAGRVPATSARELFTLEAIEQASEADLRTIDAVESALRSARAHIAELDERRALSDVARAQSHAPALIAMPMGRVFLAEVEISLALVAWQLGNRSLAEASIARAVALDPRRRLRAADADPDLVALADAILAANERLPRVVLEVQASVEGATVFLDDVLVGRTPLRIESRAGAHVVRVVAPLHAPYATLVTIERDVTLDVALSPRPVATLVARLEHALDEGDVEGAVALLARLGAEGRPLGLAYVRDTRVILCAPEGCTTAMSSDTIDVGREMTSSAAEALESLGGEDDSARLGRSERLRDERRAMRARSQRRRRILAISGGVLSAIVVTSVALAARPTTERLRVTVAFE